MWVSDVVSGLQRVWGGLPQLDPVAFGVDQPGEPAGAFLCLLAVDRDPGRTELGHHGVQVADAEVEHPGLLGAAEVVGVGGERREHRGATLLPPERVTALHLARRFRRAMDRATEFIETAPKDERDDWVAKFTGMKLEVVKEVTLPVYSTAFNVSSLQYHLELAVRHKLLTKPFDINAMIFKP